MSHRRPPLLLYVACEGGLRCDDDGDVLRRFYAVNGEKKVLKGWERGGKYPNVGLVCSMRIYCAAIGSRREVFGSLPVARSKPATVMARDVQSKLISSLARPR